MHLGKTVTRQDWMKNRHIKNMIFLITIVLLQVLLSLVVSTAKADNVEYGKIAGQVINKDNGQPLVGATVAIQGTALGAICDLDGKYRITKVPVGTYTITATSVGFTQINMNEIVVTEGESTPLNFIMSPQVLETEGVRVEARADNNTQAVLLHRRRNAAAVTDGVSAQEMSRSGSGDAAEAMTKVTGASVVDGKFVFVRGLGDRYANTQLNGSKLPSPDPDKQAVPIDMIPTGLLDNIIVEKTFTPDKPGDFAGGSVNLSTKDYPEVRSLTLSSSTGTNTEARFGDIITLQQRGSKDWLGYDDGQRAIPDIIQNNPEIQKHLPTSTSITILEEHLDDSMYIIDYMDASAKAFNPEMIAKEREIPLNQSHQLSYGDQFSINGHPLGVVASLSYSRKYSSYQNGQVNSYSDRTSHFTGLMAPVNEFNEVKGVEEVLWGGLINLKYGFHPNHKIGWSLMQTRNGESESRFLVGTAPEYTSVATNPLRNPVQWYTERKLTTNQFSGSHSLFDSKVRTDWQIAISKTYEEDPDVRFMTDELQFNSHLDTLGNTVVDTSYNIVPSRFPRPKRLWREIDEKNDQYVLNVSVPLGSKSKFKQGVEVLYNHRDVTETRFLYVNDANYLSYHGDINSYLEDVGVSNVTIDTITAGPNKGKERYRFRFSNFLREISLPQNNYAGDKEIYATYGMFEFPLPWNFYFVGGVRYEETNMSTTSATGAMLSQGIDQEDILPSANLIFRLKDKMNFRLAYGKTLARPTLLELSSSSIEKFNIGEIFNGNPNLQLTKIDNYDFRWEWFVNPGEIIAVSGFAKYLKNPIELVITSPININVQPRNTQDAKIYGVEFEYRRNLGFLMNTLRNFRLGGNLTLVHSEIKVDAEELAEARAQDPTREVPDTRPLAGQSPYLVNLDLAFDNWSSGTSLSLFYNVFGRRLEYNSEGLTPDVYEQPRHQLDFIGSQRIIGSTTFKLSVKNILDQDYKLVYDNRNGMYSQEYVQRWYPMGISYSIGMSYDIW